jgi:hypothetical protein
VAAITSGGRTLMARELGPEVLVPFDVFLLGHDLAATP